MGGTYLTEKTLRIGVEKRRGRAIAEETWNVLVNLEVVFDALEQPVQQEQEAHILKYIGKPQVRAFGGESRAEELDDTEDDDGELGEYLELDVGERARRRAHAFAARMARRLNTSREVLSFREEHLGGRALSPEEAYALLASPAALYLPAEFFEANGVPVVGHAAEIARYDFDPFATETNHLVMVRVDPPGITMKSQYAPSKPELTLPDDGTPYSRVCEYKGREGDEVKPPTSWPLAYHARDGYKKTIYPWPRSILYKLRQASHDLARVFGWKEEDMVWLLLTGEAPYLNPLRVSVSYARGKPPTVKMEAAAWMPAEVVEANFKNVQRQLLPGGPDKTPARSLEVCAFVERHIQDAPEKSVWPYLWGKWNTEHPTDRFPNFKSFYKAYHRAMPKVLQGYQMPKLSPEQERHRQAVLKRGYDAARRALAGLAEQQDS